MSGRPLRFEGYDMHHRRPGGKGGTSRDGQHALTNLLALDPQVHNLHPRSVHMRPLLARPRGYLLSTSTADPALVPVHLRGQRWVFLSRAGGYLPVPEQLVPILVRNVERAGPW